MKNGEAVFHEQIPWLKLHRLPKPCQGQAAAAVRSTLDLGLDSLFYSKQGIRSRNLLSLLGQSYGKIKKAGRQTSFSLHKRTGTPIANLSISKVSISREPQGNQERMTDLHPPFDEKRRFFYAKFRQHQ